MFAILNLLKFEEPSFCFFQAIQYATTIKLPKSCSVSKFVVSESALSTRSSLARVSKNYDYGHPTDDIVV